MGMNDTAQNVQAAMPPQPTFVDGEFGKVRDATPEETAAVVDNIMAHRYAADKFADMFERISQDADRNRTIAMAGLINLFNHAIQKQAGRTSWTVEDTTAFIYALQEIDGIGRKAQDAALAAYAPPAQR